MVEHAPKILASEEKSSKWIQPMNNSTSVQDPQAKDVACLDQVLSRSSM